MSRKKEEATLPQARRRARRSLAACEPARQQHHAKPVERAGAQRLGVVGAGQSAGRRRRRVLPEWQAMIATRSSGIFGLYPPHRAVPSKVRAFLDFLQRKFGRTPYWEAGLA